MPVRTPTKFYRDLAQKGYNLRKETKAMWKENLGHGLHLLSVLTVPFFVVTTLLYAASPFIVLFPALAGVAFLGLAFYALGRWLLNKSKEEAQNDRLAQVEDGLISMSISDAPYIKSNTDVLVVDKVYSNGIVEAYSPTTRHSGLYAQVRVIKRKDSPSPSIQSSPARVLLPDIEEATEDDRSVPTTPVTSRSS